MPLTHALAWVSLESDYQWGGFEMPVGEPNRFGMSRSRHLPIAAIAIAVGLLLGGCSPAAPPVDPEPSHSVPIPKPTVETPVAQEPDNPSGPYYFGITDDQIAATLAVGQGELLIRSLGDRLDLALWYAQNLDMAKFGADYAKVSKDPLDVLPAEVSIDNTPDEIYTLTSTMSRMPFSLAKENGASLDADAAKRMIAGRFVDPSSSSHYQSLIDAVNGIMNNDQIAISARPMAAGGIFERGTVNSASEIYTDGDGLPCRDINVTESNSQGDKLTADMTVCLATGTSGASMWVQK
jgi:hypothetical protein